MYSGNVDNNNQQNNDAHGWTLTANIIGLIPYQYRPPERAGTGNLYWTHRVVHTGIQLYQ